MKTKAEFRAKREALGLTQREFSNETDVDVRTIGRWENPNCTPIPEEAWDTLNTLSEEFDELVSAIISEATSRKEEEIITLYYYRDNWEMQDCSKHKRSCSFVNAATREAAKWFEATGANVRFEYLYHSH